MCVLTFSFCFFQYGELFDKIDVTKEGTVDWDMFALHMLLEFYERDDRVKSTQVPQWKDLKHLPRYAGSYLSSYPGYFQESYWKSMGLPEISRVTWQVCRVHFLFVSD